MVTLNTFSDVLKVVLQIVNIIVLGYAFYKFTKKPHDTLEQRVTTLEVEFKEQQQSLKQGNDRFREQDDKFCQQDKTNSVLIHSCLALIEFEVHYCETEQKPISKNLERAKDDLQDFLAQK